MLCKVGKGTVVLRRTTAIKHNAHDHENASHRGWHPEATLLLLSPREKNASCVRLISKETEGLSMLLQPLACE